MDAMLCTSCILSDCLAVTVRRRSSGHHHRDTRFL